MDDSELLEIATHASERAYAPYSGVRVGAAVLAHDGRVFTGANVENASYGLSLCAERAALARALAEGVKAGQIEVVAATASPCGACRQWLVELAPTRVLYRRTDGTAASSAPAELLPDAFWLLDP